MCLQPHRLGSTTLTLRFLHTPRANMELHSYMKDGMIENWDLFEKIIDYSYDKIIQSESQYHPVLFSECPWNLRQKTRKTHRNHV
ncbi:hypothetical protein MTP99_017111 [Tenebrio molitor]|nr:hypothetical protein MTP99_017111 [Tenebrio molitor]